MERPTWATITGILAIVFGSFGIIGGAQEVVMPYMLDMQKEMLHSMNELVQQTQQKNAQSKIESEVSASQDFNPFAILHFLNEKMEIPDWFRTYAPVFGGISILISGFYLFSGIFLLMLKPLAPVLFQITLGVSILWGIISATIYGMSENALLIMSIPGSIAGIVIDIVLLVVLLIGNKDAFRQSTKPA